MPAEIVLLIAFGLFIVGLTLMASPIDRRGFLVVIFMFGISILMVVWFNVSSLIGPEPITKVQVSSVVSENGEILVFPYENKIYLVADHFKEDLKEGDMIEISKKPKNLGLVWNNLYFKRVSDH